MPSLKPPTLPHLTEIDPTSVSTWLESVEEDLGIWLVFNGAEGASVLTMPVRITLAGSAMREKSAAQWWKSERTDLKKLDTWEKFVAKVTEKFAPGGWKMRAGRRFFWVRQAGRSVDEYLADLESARVDLSSAGAFWKVSDHTLVKHLVFGADPALYHRCAKLDLENTTLGTVVDMLKNEYAGLAAEGIVHPRISMALPPAASLTPSASTVPISQTSTSTFIPPLSPAERDRIKALNGCFRCRHTPQSPGWIAHTSRDCPGDPATGLPPRRQNNQPVLAVGIGPTVWDEYNQDADHEHDQARPAVFYVGPSSAQDLATWGSSDEEDSD